jgi:hypothetical protein
MVCPVCDEYVTWCKCGRKSMKFLIFVMLLFVITSCGDDYNKREWVISEKEKWIVERENNLLRQQEDASSYYKKSTDVLGAIESEINRRMKSLCEKKLGTGAKYSYCNCSKEIPGRITKNYTMGKDECVNSIRGRFYF